MWDINLWFRGNKLELWDGNRSYLLFLATTKKYKMYTQNIEINIIIVSNKVRILSLYFAIITFFLRIIRKRYELWDKKKSCNYFFSLSHGRNWLWEYHIGYWVILVLLLLAFSIGYLIVLPIFSIFTFWLVFPSSNAHFKWVFIIM